MKMACLLINLAYFGIAFSQNIDFSNHTVERYEIDIKQFKLHDFEGDGDLDILIPKIGKNGNDHEFKWYENINDEFHVRFINDFNFSHLPEYRFGNALYADIDGNGLLDIYSIVPSSKHPFHDFEIYRFKQTSPYVFQRELFFSGNPDKSYVFEITDLNNDLQADIVTFEEDVDNPSNGNYNVNYYINNNGKFSKYNLATENSSYTNHRFNEGIFTDAYIVDMNTDGHKDIVYINSEELYPDMHPGLFFDYIVYQKNLGNGNFNRQLIGGMNDVAYTLRFFERSPILNIKDKNQDGLLDVYIPTHNSHIVSPSIFTQTTEDNFEYNELNLTDVMGFIQLLVDEDSCDIITMSLGTSTSMPLTVNYFTDNDDSSYTRTYLFDVESHSTDAQIIDLKNDNINDYVMADSNVLQLMQYDTQKGEYIKKQIGEEFLGNVGLIKSLEFNRDENKELIAISSLDNHLFLYNNQNSTDFNAVKIDDSNTIGIATTDINKDGLSDIMAINYISSTDVGLFWFENINGEYFTKHFITSIATENVQADTVFEFKDLDNDGDLDLLQLDDPGVKWYEHESNQFSGAKTIILDNSNEYYDLNFIDFDNDSDIDITYSSRRCAAAFCLESALWIELNDANEYIPHYIEKETSYRVFKAVDLDNDGILDFLVKTYGNESYIWKGKIDGYDVVPFNYFNLYPSDQIMDMNNDGLNDIVHVNEIYINTGDFGFVKTDIPFGSSSNYNRLIKDINMDGLQDIIYHPNGRQDSLSLLKRIYVPPILKDSIYINGFENVKNTE